MNQATGFFQKSVGILGAGSIGGTAAGHLARAGYKVWIVGSQGPAGLERFSSAWPDIVFPADPWEAVQSGEVVLLAVHWAVHAEALAAAGGCEAFEGKLVIDAMNPYRPGGGLFKLDEPSSQIVARAVGPGAAVVKAFNTLRADRLANGTRPAGSSDRIAVPIAGDDAHALAMARTLIDDMGFDALPIGTLAASQAMEPGQALYDTALPLAQLLAAAASMKTRH